jgi:hypothetical protein
LANTLELTFYYGNDCGVCAADQPRVQALADQYQVNMVSKFIGDHLAEASQLLIFTIPALILRRGGSELFRQVRIIDFHQLEMVLQKETRV